jgi:hypothetical protein
LPGNERSKDVAPFSKSCLQLQSPLLQKGWALNSNRNVLAQTPAIAKKRCWQFLFLLQLINSNNIFKPIF